MGKSKLFVKEIISFKDWEIGGSKTQSTSVLTEKFVEDCVQKIYKEVIIFKMGSQQHPDFLIAPLSVRESINTFSNGKSITKGILEKWEESEHNKNKIRLVRLEVKTGDNVYTLNDTFPEPSKMFDEIYVLFSIKDRQIFITTSFTMANKCHCNPPIEKRLIESKKTIENFGDNLKRIWNGTGISTAARPTYRMNKEYAHHQSSSEEISEIFKSAGISD